MPRYGRSGREWNAARAAVLKRSSVCALCGDPLDFNAPARTRWSPTVDHIVPLSATESLGPALHKRMASDLRNLRAMHYGCNSARGNRTAKPRREW
jgi:5-methylcytosine-specific restriction endonuclease McrA